MMLINEWYDSPQLSCDWFFTEQSEVDVNTRSSAVGKFILQVRNGHSYRCEYVILTRDKVCRMI